MLGTPLPARQTLAAAGIAERSGPDAAAARDQAAGQQGNSCIIVLATDAPLDARQLARIARRAIFAMARVGSSFQVSSGDYALAFSTAPGDRLLAEADLDQLFVATMDSTEEAILNSLFMAETTTGFRGRVRNAVPLDAVRAACRYAR